MQKSADEKRNKILDVAKRRFAHYGLAKTTMAEIAKDLAFSKALLYYYFPDKTSLYMAVIQDISDEMNLDIEESILRMSSTEEGILSILSKRIEYLKRYFYIIEYTIMNRKEASPEISALLVRSFTQQRNFVKKVFEQGVELGELLPMNVEEHADIFLNACLGMRYIVIKDYHSNILPDREDFDAVLLLQNKLAHTYIKGLKA